MIPDNSLCIRITPREKCSFNYYRETFAYICFYYYNSAILTWEKNHWIIFPVTSWDHKWIFVFSTKKKPTHYSKGKWIFIPFTGRKTLKTMKKKILTKDMELCNHFCNQNFCFTFLLKGFISIFLNMHLHIRTGIFCLLKSVLYSKRRWCNQRTSWNKKFICNSSLNFISIGKHYAIVTFFRNKFRSQMMHNNFLFEHTYTIYDCDLQV